jgi:hypothetical protein
MAWVSQVCFVVHVRTRCMITSETRTCLLLSSRLRQLKGDCTPSKPADETMDSHELERFWRTELECLSATIRFCDKVNASEVEYSRSCLARDCTLAG